MSFPPRMNFHSQVRDAGKLTGRVAAREPVVSNRGGARGATRSARGGSAAWIIAVSLLFSLLPRPASSAEVSKEYQVKAVFLWRLAQFTTWPSNAFENADSPLVIGVLGDNPFGGALEAAVRGETAQGRPIVVQPFRRADQIKTCHVLFISDPDTNRVKTAITALGNRSILTVGDTDGFLQAHGGIVQFFTEQNKIKVRINLDTATAAGLTLDARLLRMAEVIRKP